jgi:hypothetical protein
MQCGINPGTQLRNLTIKTKPTINDQVSKGITPWNLLSKQEQTRQHHALSRIRNNPFSTDHREIAAKSSLSAEIIPNPRQKFDC